MVNALKTYGVLQHLVDHHLIEPSSPTPPSATRPSFGGQVVLRESLQIYEWAFHFKLYKTSLVANHCFNSFFTLFSKGKILVAPFCDFWKHKIMKRPPQSKKQMSLSSCAPQMPGCSPPHQLLAPHHWQPQIHLRSLQCCLFQKVTRPVTCVIIPCGWIYQPLHLFGCCLMFHCVLCHYLLPPSPFWDIWTTSSLGN